MKKKQKNHIFILLNKVSTDRTTRNIAFCCLAIVAVCIALCIAHISKIVSLFSDTYRDEVRHGIEITDGELERTIIRQSDILRTNALTLTTITEDNRDSIVDALEAMATTTQFDSISYIRYSNSMKYSSDGTVNKVDYNRYEKLIEECIGKLYIFYDDFDNDRSIISVAAPVERDSVKEGYLVGKVNIQEQVGDILNGEIDSYLDALLIDGDGNVLCVGSSNTVLRNVKNKNFYSEIIRSLIADDSAIEMTIDEMRMSVFSGNIDYIDQSGKEYGDVYIVYASLPRTHSWTLVYCLFESTLNKMLRPIIIEAFATVLGMILLIIAMTALGVHYAQRENKKIHDLAFTDELTGAPNENAFKQRAKELLEEYADVPYVISCFDIVNFRYINEGYGHEKADVVLKALAEGMMERLSYNEAFGRIGADRFVSLTVDDGRDEDRRRFMSEYIGKVTTEILLNYPIRIKTGIYWVSNREESISSMIDKANLARKAISVDSKTFINEYVDKLMEQTRKEEQIESQMENALADREFVPYLQPKWDMKNNHICGAEALVRWKRKDGTIVPPGDFIPIFEKNGFIEKVDFYMLESICAYLRNMIDEGRSVYPVSINQSRFLLHNPEYVSRVQQILLKYKIPSGLVELEITETVFTHDKDYMLQIMNKLKDLNMELSMDDFGSGYSSLNLLRDIPFDVLKIDRGFLDESTQSDSGKWILCKIVEMAEGLDLRVICEGVETEEQVRMLLDIGCIYAQGFLYSRPIPMEEFMEKYNTHESK